MENKTNNQKENQKETKTTGKQNNNNNPNNQTKPNTNTPNNNVTNNKQKENQEDINAKVNKLLIENNQLKKEIENKDTLIKNYEDQINQFNTNYKNEIAKKTNEAQNLVNLKVKEAQEKFEKEIAHIKKFALKDKAIDLINIINNFDLAVSHTPDDPNLANYVQGFRMFVGMFQNYLSSNNISVIEPKLGDEYDHITMEAFETQENNDYKTNQVIKVIKKGYKLHDVVIIPATVVVCKNKKDKN